MLTFILRPYSRVNTENPYPILDLFPEYYFLNLVRCRTARRADFKMSFTGKLFQTKFFKQLISFAENDTLF